jgi:C4-dicarboxylate transporter DctM subunit
MDPLLIGLLMFAGMLVLMALRVPIAVAMFIPGALGYWAMTNDAALLNQLKGSAVARLTVYDLSVIPLFLLMGQFATQGGLSRALFKAAAAFVGHIRGGLAMASILSAAAFGAVCGSSVATSATITQVAYPEMKAHGYSGRLATATLASGGTLGILIPPSINLVIYGVLTNSSVPKLYLAGIIPGLMLAGLFMAVIAAACIARPQWGGHRVRATWGERLASLAHLLPPLGIFMLVVGSIYAGIATPTEAAALGVVGALVLAASFGRLKLAMLREAVEGTMRATAMIMLIVIAAGFLNFVMSATGLTSALTASVTGLGLSPAWTLLVIVIFYVVLGCFMETLSMMITTIPIVAPIMFALGFDPIWFGIVLIILVEMALITPPVGLNLFVVQSLRKSGSMHPVIMGSLPFVVAMFVMIALLAAVPGLALWLPSVFG